MEERIVKTGAKKKRSGRYPWGEGEDNFDTAEKAAIWKNWANSLSPKKMMLL